MARKACNPGCLPGGHRKAIKIEKATDVDAFGGPTQTWSTHVETKAVIEPLRGRELWFARSVNAETTHKVTLRYKPGVTPKMRVIYDSRTLEIESTINVDENNRILELMCKEAV